MNSVPADEPPIDTSLTHYLEERALAIAREKANTPGQRAKVERLAALRDDLMHRRRAFDEEALARRHARGEIYSKARVAAINAIGPSQSELDKTVATTYVRRDDAEGVLKSHARSHFGFGLVSARLLLADMPPDLADAARAMHAHEDAFASAWIAAIGDAAFTSELRELQRQALRMLRTASRPMYLVTSPPSIGIDDLDARGLGKAWSKLDALAEDLGVEPLSTFIALPGENEAAGVPAGRILPTIASLIDAVQDPGRKFPSRKALLPVLAQVRDALIRTGDAGGRAHFEVDI